MSAAPLRGWALVPVKAFSLAKSRLAPVLGPRERAALARALFEHVLGVLGACPELDGTLVVTTCPEVRALAEAQGATVIADAVPEGLGLIVDAGLAELAARGADAALVLMSDLPLLTRADVRALLALLADHPLVLAPDDRDEGTNALAVAPPSRIVTSFGKVDSFARHRAIAEAAGLDAAVHRSAGLGFDVDGPDDLTRLRARGSSPASAASAIVALAKR